MTIEEFEILKSYIQVADYHAHRLGILEPFIKENITAMTTDNKAALDSLVYRFDFLQKVIGRKIFPTLLKALCEFNSEDTYIDRLNKLEKFSILPSSSIWRKMIDLQDKIENEYFSQDPQALSEALNKFMSYSRTLLEYWDMIKQYIFNREKQMGSHSL